LSERYLKNVLDVDRYNNVARNYMQAIKELSEKYNALVIFDEIQCGMGRTGKLFAYENFEIIPDIVTVAKSLGGGVPIGAALTKGKANDVLEPGDHGSTYGGNPLVCAVANAVLHELIDNKLIEKNVAPPMPNSTPVAIMIRLMAKPIVIPAIPFKPKFCAFPIKILSTML